jgi:hypothetical protein
MRRISAFAAVAAVCGVFAPVASAGAPTIDPNGNVLMLDAQFNTPATSSSRTAQGAIFEMHHFYGNFRGGPTPSEASNISFNFPKGTLINNALFARCPVPTQETFGNESRCPAASKMGTGTVSVDARRSGIPDQLNGTVNVYNGATRNGVGTLAIIATIPVPGSPNPIRSEIDFEIRKGPQLVEYDTLPPAPDNSASFDLTSFSLKVGKTVNGVHKGRKVKIPYFVTPKTCSKNGWAFALTLTRATAGNTVARDTAPCLKVTG